MTGLVSLASTMHSIFYLLAVGKVIKLVYVCHGLLPGPLMLGSLLPILSSIAGTSIDAAISMVEANSMRAKKLNFILNADMLIPVCN